MGENVEMCNLIKVSVGNSIRGKGEPGKVSVGMCNLPILNGRLNIARNNIRQTHELLIYNSMGSKYLKIVPDEKRQARFKRYRTGRSHSKVVNIS